MDPRFKGSSQRMRIDRSVVNEAVEDGVGQGGVSDGLMPMPDGKLAGDEGGLSSDPVLQDLEKVAALRLAEGSESEVAQGQQPGFLEPVHELGIGAVGPGEGEVLQEPGETEVATGETLPTGGLGESAGQEGLSGARGPADEGDMVVADPVATGQPKDVGAVEASRGAEVEFLDTCRKPKLGLTEESGETAVLTDGGFPLQEKAEAVLEGEVLDIRDGLLFFQGGSHAGEAHLAQSSERWFKEHRTRPQFQVE
jgi:hypothetical protein